MVGCSTSNFAGAAHAPTRIRKAYQPSPIQADAPEHLASYQVARFHALDALLAFMRRVLTEVEAQEGAA